MSIYQDVVMPTGKWAINTNGILHSDTISMYKDGKEWLRVNKTGELQIFDIDAMYAHAALGDMYAIAFRAVYEAGKKEQQ
jgi:hypothetical protein